MLQSPIVPKYADDLSHVYESKKLNYENELVSNYPNVLNSFEEIEEKMKQLISKNNLEKFNQIRYNRGLNKTNKMRIYPEVNSVVKLPNSSQLMHDKPVNDKLKIISKDNNQIDTMYNYTQFGLTNPIISTPQIENNILTNKDMCLSTAIYLKNTSSPNLNLTNTLSSQYSYPLTSHVKNNSLFKQLDVSKISPDIKMIINNYTELKNVVNYDKLSIDYEKFVYSLNTQNKLLHKHILKTNTFENTHSNFSKLGINNLIYKDIYGSRSLNIFENNLKTPLLNLSFYKKIKYNNLIRRNKLNVRSYTSGQYVNNLNVIKLLHQTKSILHKFNVSDNALKYNPYPYTLKTKIQQKIQNVDQIDKILNINNNMFKRYLSYKRKKLNVESSNYENDRHNFYQTQLKNKLKSNIYVEKMTDNVYNINKDLKLRAQSQQPNMSLNIDDINYNTNISSDVKLKVSEHQPFPQINQDINYDYNEILSTKQKYVIDPKLDIQLNENKVGLGLTNSILKKNINQNNNINIDNENTYSSLVGLNNIITRLTNYNKNNLTFTNDSDQMLQLNKIKYLKYIPEYKYEFKQNIFDMMRIGNLKNRLKKKNSALIRYEQSSNMINDIILKYNILKYQDNRSQLNIIYGDNRIDNNINNSIYKLNNIPNQKINIPNDNLSSINKLSTQKYMLNKINPSNLTIDNQNTYTYLDKLTEYNLKNNYMVDKLPSRTEIF